MKEIIQKSMYLHVRRREKKKLNCERYSELNKRGVKCRRGKGVQKAKEKQNKGKK